MQRRHVLAWSGAVIYRVPNRLTVFLPVLFHLAGARDLFEPLCEH